ncbi:Type 1 glutamine amidotransferase-like domain-containing protein [Fusibacter sp. 3D3]|uniref:Type 1 glutamine amidotransferase-like domain-containing protein n=1 Tax=Fusibacter sp. 3D3 TaxID=1048380 RepID=UPI000852EC9D|nr:Type 1 glutamine amidotransferase-like domain-containing protein [Fusibacter sp. 3D3]GAU79651.1 alpha-aspartyl dipeptidase peptidase E [Fusibacter sp. 3D3]
MKLFLAAYFKRVAPLLTKYMQCEGQKVVFITTASKVEKVKFYVKADKNALLKLGFIVEELDVSIEETAEIQAKINACDCIFVEGGNTFFLLQELKRSGADQMILEHIQKNKMYIGASAGSMIISKNIEYAKHMDNPAYALELNGDYSALGAINFCIVPHYLNSPFKKAVEKIIIEYTNSLTLYPISNNQAVVVEGDHVKVVN